MLHKLDADFTIRNSNMKNFIIIGLAVIAAYVIGMHNNYIAVEPIPVDATMLDPTGK